MEIGKEKETIVIEPLEVPVPGFEDVPYPEPNYEPAPEEEVVEEPELVPAGS